MEKTVKKLKLKKEIKGYLLMILATVFNMLAIIKTACSLGGAMVLFLYNLAICLLVLIITNDKK